MVKNGPPGLPVRQAEDQGHPVPHRLPRKRGATLSTSPLRPSPNWRPWSGDEGNEYYQPTTWQISNIHAGTGANNVVPGTGRAPVQFPLLHGQYAGKPAGAFLPRHPRQARPGLRNLLDPGRPPLPHPPRHPGRRGLRRHPGGSRHYHRVVHHRRHLGWSLHRGHLRPDGGTRPSQRHQPQDRRMHRRRRPAPPLRHLSTPFGKAARPMNIAAAQQELSTVRDLIRYAVSQFTAAKLFFGHGSSNAWDEAVYLVLHSLNLPLDELETLPRCPAARRRARRRPRHHPAPSGGPSASRLSHP